MKYLMIDVLRLVIFESDSYSITTTTALITNIRNGRAIENHPPRGYINMTRVIYCPLNDLSLLASRKQLVLVKIQKKNTKKESTTIKRKLLKKPLLQWGLYGINLYYKLPCHRSNGSLAYIIQTASLGY